VGTWLLIGVTIACAVGASGATASEQRAAPGQGFKIVRTWGKTGTANGQFRNASGIAVDGSDTVYVADTDNNRVQVFSKSGAFLRKWGSEGRGNGQFSLAEDVDLGSDGTVWTGDQGNGRAQAFSATGAFKTSLTLPDGLARGVAVDAGNNVYVASEGSTEGGYRRFAKNANGWDGAGPVIGAIRLSRPEDVEASPDGSIYLVRTPTQGGVDTVQRFSADGKLLGSFKLGVGEGGRGIAVDLDCNVWASDWSKVGGLVKHSPSGKVLATATLPYIERDVAVGPHGDLYALIQSQGSVVVLAEDKSKPATANVPGRIAVKGGKATIRYGAGGFACPSQVDAKATLKGKGVSGTGSAKIAAGRFTSIPITVRGPAGKTVKATFTIVLKTNGRPTTEKKTVQVSFAK
jgi:sugar lactone lactonase YvrE